MTSIGQPQPETHFSPAEREALEHAWQWFCVHAQQRLNCLNYFVVGATLLAAGYATAVKEMEFTVAALTSLLGVVFAVGFLGLEKRAKNLIKLGERAIRPLQLRLSALTGNPDLQLFSIAEAKKHRLVTYRQTIGLIEVSTLVFFGIALGYALLRLYNLL